MAKKRDRIVNTQPFISDDASVASSRKRSKVPKTHQKQEKVSFVIFSNFKLLECFNWSIIWVFLQLIEAGMSEKIMKQALAQQKEVADEENAERNPSSAAFAVAGAATAGEEQKILEEEEDDIDDFDGTFENQSQFDKQVSILILYSISLWKL